MRGGGAALRLLRSRIFQQAAVFTASNVLASVLGMLAKALLARSITPEQFGSLSFALAFLSFTALFFDFGLFLPAGRLAAKEGREVGREVVGAAVLMSVPVCLLFSVVVFALSYGVEGWFHADVDGVLRVVAPLALVFPFAQLSILFAQGLDRLNVFSTTYTIGNLVFVAGTVVLVWSGTPSVTAVVVVKTASLLVAAAILVAWLRPRLGNARRHARRLLHDGRTYGFQVYVGRVLSIGTYQMDVLMLAAYTNPKTVGYYVLAGAVAYGLGLPVLGMATALFPQMASAHELNARWVWLATAIGAGMVGIALLTAGPVIELIFSSQYVAAAALVGPLVAAEAIRGVTSVYNSYLSAQGRGRELRNAALVLTTSNVAFNVTLIPAFGALGAAWASLLALAANLIAHIVAYRRSRSVPVLAQATE